MKTVQVRLANAPYPIHIGNGLIPRVGKLLPTSKAFILADENLTRQARLLASVLKKAGSEVSLVLVPATEEFKSIEKIQSVYGEMLEAGCDRHSVLYALGGGVLGDAGGFIAGTYMRGIRWVGVPTTLLSQVDSSIGGKTGVNHAHGKNLIGVFHQPSLVLCDTSLLRTLPAREVISGLGEIVKYGLIYDAPFFDWLTRNWQKLLALQPAALEHAVAICVKWKARTVAQDERDLSGVREVLNFGHTLGHALESVTRYRHFRHGEAIILGMRAAAFLSERQGHLKPAERERIDGFLKQLPVPAIPRAVRTSEVVGRVRFDKKSRGGKVRFVLLKRIGKTVLDSKLESDDLYAALEELR